MEAFETKSVRFFERRVGCGFKEMLSLFGLIESLE